MEGKLEQDDLDTESSNDDYVGEIPPKPIESYECAESFRFEDGKGRVIHLTSAAYKANDLAWIAAQFLGLDITISKPNPGYTG